MIVDILGRANNAPLFRFDRSIKQVVLGRALAHASLKTAKHLREQKAGKSAPRFELRPLYPNSGNSVLAGKQTPRKTCTCK